MNNISLIIVTYNEEQRIAGCLNDIRPFVDEIVLVDQQSTDQTIEKAWPFIDVIVKDEHHGHAEPSEIKALTYTSNVWTLKIDADERCTDRMKLLLGDFDPNVCAYYTNLQTTIGPHVFPPEKHVRFYQKDVAYLSGKIHSEPEFYFDQPVETDWIGIEHIKTIEEQRVDNKRYINFYGGLERYKQAHGVAPWFEDYLRIAK